MNHVLSIVGLALLCGGWVALQRWIGQRDPESRGPESRTGCSSCSCGTGGDCKNTPKVD